MFKKYRKKHQLEVLTQEKIKEIAKELFLVLWNLGEDEDLRVYYSNKYIHYDSKHTCILTKTGVFADEYCEYAPFNNLITIATEGLLSDYFEMTSVLPKEVEDVLDKYHLEWEANESWNWSIYPKYGWYSKVEYFPREEKKEENEDNRTKLEKLTALFQVAPPSEIDFVGVFTNNHLLKKKEEITNREEVNTEPEKTLIEIPVVINQEVN